MKYTRRLRASTMVEMKGLAITAGSKCLALCVPVIIAKVVGGMLPMVAKAMHLDPAVMASPFISTIVDALSLLVYFMFAKTLLGI